MPIYEYQCQQCQTTFESLRNFSQADQPIACITCGNSNCKRLISRFNSHGEKMNSSTVGGCNSCSSHSCGSCSCH